jgi:hypothetical protein
MISEKEVVTKEHPNPSEIVPGRDVSCWRQVWRPSYTTVGDDED